MQFSKNRCEISLTGCLNSHQVTQIFLCYLITTQTRLFFLKSGSHLLSHTVTSIVPSAAYVLTIVFEMCTGVSHKRIATRNI